MGFLDQLTQFKLRIRNQDPAATLFVVRVGRMRHTGKQTGLKLTQLDSITNINIEFRPCL